MADILVHNETQNLGFVNPKKVPKRFVDDIKKVTGSSVHTERYDADQYIIDKVDYLNLLSLFKKKINSLRISISNIKEKLNLSTLKNLEQLYTNTVIEAENGLGSTDEQVVKTGMLFIAEYSKVETAIKRIYDIKRILFHARSQDVIFTEKIENEFCALQRRESSPEEYIKLYESLANIIRGTYLVNLNKSQGIAQDDALCFIGTDGNDEATTKIIDEKNISDHEYGFIYEPDDFDMAFDSGDKLFKVFDSLDRNASHVVLKEGSTPSAVYVTTLGEKEFSKRYISATEFATELDLPVIQIDLSRYLSEDEKLGYVKELVDELIEEKFALADEKQKPSDLNGIKDYAKFMYFFNEFQKLKQKNYTKDELISLFEHCYNLLYDASALNLEEIVDYSFNHRDSDDFINTAVAKIRLASKYNPYFEFNFFENKCPITVEDVHNFISYFEKYCDDKKGNEEIKEVLEKVYPGINIDYVYFTKLNDAQIVAFVEYVNHNGGIDSWYLSQAIQPRHRITSKSLDIEKMAEEEVVETPVESAPEEVKEEKVSVRQLLKACQEDLIKREM